MPTCRPLRALLTLLSCSIAHAQTTLSLPATADATIYAESENAGGAGVSLFTGATSQGNARRSVLRFDLTAIPPDAIVTGVELDLTPTFSNANHQAHALHRLTMAWVEGSSGGGGQGTTPMGGDVTWSWRDYAVDPWSIPGASFVASASAQATLLNTGTQTVASTAALVADVQGWVVTPSASFGWILLGTESTAGAAYRIAAREAGMSGPTLRVTYLLPSIVAPFGDVACSSLTIGPVGGLPTIGNAGFGVEFANAPASITARAVLIGLVPLVQPVLLLACPIWVDPGTIFVVAATDAAGRLGLPLANDPGLLGFRLVLQGVGIDTATGTALVTSNGLAIRVGG